MRFPCLNREHLFLFHSLFYYYTPSAQTAPPCIIFLLSPAAAHLPLQYTHTFSPSAKIHIFLCRRVLHISIMHTSDAILSVNNFCPCHFYCRKTRCSIIHQWAPIYAHSLSHSPQSGVCWWPRVFVSADYCSANNLLSESDFNYILPI